MRILHTSDWHLGRSLHGVRLLDAQAAFADHLVEVVTAERVDLVVLAGDVFDRALPPVDAVELADETFARLAATPARVVVTSGNHDSHVRLGYNSRLAEFAGVFFRTRWQDVGVPVLLEDAHGPVAVHGLPYLEPDAVRTPWQLASRSHEAAVGEAMKRVRADLATRRGTRSVVLAHAFVAGRLESSSGETSSGDTCSTDTSSGGTSSLDAGAVAAMSSDSERDISVGGLQIVPTSVFTGVDYTALGHLHGRHTLGESVRYSGSPLAYSFSEAGHTKGSWLVDLGPAGVCATQFVPAPVPRRLARLRGDLDALLADNRHTGLEDAWLAVTLTDERRPLLAMDRLRARFPHTLTLGFEPRGSGRGRGPVLPRVDGRSDFDIALGFVAEVRELEATTEEALLLRLACDSCHANADPDADRHLDVGA